MVCPVVGICSYRRLHKCDYLHGRPTTIIAGTVYCLLAWLLFVSGCFLDMMLQELSYMYVKLREKEEG